jgi:hypothetical protein
MLQSLAGNVVEKTVSATFTTSPEIDSNARVPRTDTKHNDFVVKTSERIGK